jgi:type II restriction enzyme
VTVISPEALRRRNRWVVEIARISGNFGQDVARVQAELEAEVARFGPSSLLDHIRLCGAIPESYGHDSSEEKLYSKYTDIVLASCFTAIGLSCSVLTERADAADVEVVCADYSFVADAKAFRLSRTAKNQKDFKIQAMDTWKRGSEHALLVCPVYQLPAHSSQIYQQAASRNVCILSYSHLAVLLRLAMTAGPGVAQKTLDATIKRVEQMVPAKGAADYWTPINDTILAAGDNVRGIWTEELQATSQAIGAARAEGMGILSRDKERILALSREEAISSLLELHRFDARIDVINGIGDNGLMGLSSLS